MSRIDRAGAWVVLATLGVLVAIDVPELGSDPWPFHPATVHPHGLLGPLVRAAGRHWDLGLVRTPGVLAGFLVALVALVGWRRSAWRADVLGGLAVVVALALLVPAVALQAGLRESTEPWLDVNDSTYQIEIAGSLLRHGHDPYGRNYTGTGLERWYPAAGFPVGRKQVALHHLAYFPGTPLTAAAWGVLPSPLDDYRFFTLVCTLALFFAALAFRGPPWLRIALGAVAVANPLAVRAVWFGTADAPALLCLVLAFALLSRRRFVSAALLLGLAVLLKQFALVAVPFFAVMLLTLHAPRAAWRRAAVAFLAPLLVGIVPFLAANPGGLWHDTITYGGSTYRIIGYGLSSLWLKAGLTDNRYSSYPFVWFLVLVWLPVTCWLLWLQRRSTQLWEGAAAFTVSMFVLLFISRVFQTSYLVWPLIGIVCAVALTQADDERVGARPDVAGEVDGGELQTVRAGP
ncbi:MAG TPA: glycosyltransferase 87 family protein [Gaiellaceae bacterium]|nr:glycosyltransferase 87 family protein [Gaiellaceae bacterium]